jgi:sugar/nucleoside kinase (ribokinase family)
LDVALRLLKNGVQIALITMADEGCLAVNGKEAIRVSAPQVRAVDGCGAGATFSAGYIYGYLNGWTLEQSVRFATAAASLKVTRPGLQMFPFNEIMELSLQLSVERSILAADSHH